MSLTCLSTCLDQMKELVIVKGLPYSEMKISCKKRIHTLKEFQRKVLPVLTLSIIPENDQISLKKNHRIIFLEASKV